MRAFVDTNVLVRHLTGDRPEMSRRASAFLAAADGLLLTELDVAETIYVLESFYRASRADIARSIRSLIAFEAIVCVDPALLLRATEVYENDCLDFAKAYLVASAESSRVGAVASFDRSIDRAHAIQRVEPA